MKYFLKPLRTSNQILKLCPREKLGMAQLWKIFDQHFTSEIQNPFSCDPKGHQKFSENIAWNENKNSFAMQNSAKTFPFVPNVIICNQRHSVLHNPYFVGWISKKRTLCNIYGKHYACLFPFYKFQELKRPYSQNTEHTCLWWRGQTIISFTFMTLWSKNVPFLIRGHRISYI